MRAVPITRHGGPEVLQLLEVPDPTPGPGQVLVRVRGCALNHLDLWQRRGLEHVKLPLPHIPGSDISGEVVDPGESGLASGARVIVHPGLNCGHCPACLDGQDSLCATYGIVGYQSEGGYAELAAVPARNLIALPPQVSFTDGAAFPLTFLTAWHMLVSRAHVRGGETVLVMAAGSGVGQAAIQVARLHGARVIATARQKEKLDGARALGADDVVDTSQPDWSAEVRRLTNKRGADVVIEHVGAAVWEQALKSLARGGRLVTCGATSGHRGELDLRVLFAKQQSLLGSYMGTRADLGAAVEGLASGRLKPAVDSVLPLARAGDAHRRLEAHEHFGKIVLET
jgi:NADPH:quinone reductase-like Zn-dependent oxidoreductase